MVVGAQVRKTLAENWWLFLLEGIATLVLGILLLTSPGATMMVAVTFIGAYWLVTGIFSIVSIFTGDTGIPWGWLLLSGLVGILAGIFVLNHPLLSTVLIPATLVIVLGIQGLIIGAIGLMHAFSGGGWGAGIRGVLNILLGIVLLANPLVGAAVVPIVLGVLGIVAGVSLIVHSFGLRKLREE